MTAPLLLRRLLWTLPFLALGALGGWAAQSLGLPMPWMLGPLATSAVSVGLVGHRLPEDYRFPQRLRMVFVGLIGVMIGTQVRPELFQELTTLPLTLAALALFVLLAHGGNALIFRRIGGYDRATAFYSGTPGGLMESIALGESVGADIRLLTLQQFLRIILVVTIVPTALSIWAGQPVGSAAGVVPGGADPVGPGSLVLIAAAAVAGLWLAEFIHLPASQIVGPLLLSAALTLTGWVDLHLPFWLIALAQLMIGTSLGLRFRGVTARMLGRTVGLSFLSVSYMLLLGAAMAFGMWRATGLDPVQGLLSFAPGGVTEMSLIALSLSVNPAMVSLNHVLRILMTVAEMSVLARIMERRRD